MYDNGLLLSGGYDDLRSRMEQYRGAEKFWSFVLKRPYVPPYTWKALEYRSASAKHMSLSNALLHCPCTAQALP